MVITKDVIEITQVIKREFITNVFHEISKYNSVIEKLYCDSFYDDITEEDVEFLKNISGIQELNPSLKLKIFHFFLEIFSSLITLKGLNCKNISVCDLKLPVQNKKILEQIGLNKIIDNIYTSLEQLSPTEASNILDSIYPHFVCNISRKSTGTEFTPIQIVNFILDSVDFTENIIGKRILDPSVGSGVFLVQALRRMFEAYQSEGYSYIDITRSIILDDPLLVGIDINPCNVHISRLRYLLEFKAFFDNVNVDSLLNLYDDLPVYVGNTLMETSLLADINLSVLGRKYDFIVGNPPYIRLQRLPLELREKIKENYESATGRYDLYVCFIERSISMLENGGRIGLITSNKYLTANYGKGIRNFVLANLKINLITDLNDTKFFGAAVLPAILVGTKTIVDPSYKFSYVSLKQNNDTSNTGSFHPDIFLKIKDHVKNNTPVTEKCIINNGTTNMNVELSYTEVNKPKFNNYWNFSSNEEEELKRSMENTEHYTLKEIADVCVGIKTTADKAFVHPMTKRFVEKQDFEGDLIYPLLQSHNISRWKITWNENSSEDRYILYPHTMLNGKTVAIDIDKYPKCKEYLLTQRDLLESRTYVKEANRQWYECWVPQTLGKFLREKIVTRDITEKSCFVLDRNHFLCQGNTFFINVRESFLDRCTLSLQNFNYYLLGVLNSNALEFYHKTISGSLYSKKVRYTTSNLNRWVIPKINDNNLPTVRRIIQLVGSLMDNAEKDIENSHFEAELNEKVFELFSLDARCQNLIIEFLRTNT